MAIIEDAILSKKKENDSLNLLRDAIREAGEVGVTFSDLKSVYSGHRLYRLVHILRREGCVAKKARRLYWQIAPVIKSASQAEPAAHVQYTDVAVQKEHAQVLKFLADHGTGMTKSEILQHLDLYDVIQKAMCMMRKWGWISFVKSGVTFVWHITDFGKSQLEGILKLDFSKPEEEPEAVVIPQDDIPPLEYYQAVERSTLDSKGVAWEDVIVEILQGNGCRRFQELYIAALSDQARRQFNYLGKDEFSVRQGLHLAVIGMVERKLLIPKPHQDMFSLAGDGQVAPKFNIQLLVQLYKEPLRSPQEMDSCFAPEGWKEYESDDGTEEMGIEDVDLLIRVVRANSIARE